MWSEQEKQRYNSFPSVCLSCWDSQLVKTGASSKPDQDRIPYVSWSPGEHVRWCQPSSSVSDVLQRNRPRVLLGHTALSAPGVLERLELAVRCIIDARHPEIRVEQNKGACALRWRWQYRTVVVVMCGGRPWNLLSRSQFPKPDRRRRSKLCRLMRHHRRHRGPVERFLKRPKPRYSTCT
ncbi:hypothetical protein BD414DRAFT_103463 [Trametes punicea]|nr:hypothetical protein BD414DRAFT_103463 [Trametes punicea]